MGRVGKGTKTTKNGLLTLGESHSGRFAGFGRWLQSQQEKGGRKCDSETGEGERW